jgi:transcriptional regulator with XRE-family HTH domain
MARDPIVDALRAEREARNWSQRYVQERASVSPLAVGYLSRLESGTAEPRLSTLRRWADALGYDLVLVKREGG